MSSPFFQKFTLLRIFNISEIGVPFRHAQPGVPYPPLKVSYHLSYHLLVKMIVKVGCIDIPFKASMEDV